MRRQGIADSGGGTDTHQNHQCRRLCNCRPVGTRPLFGRVFKTGYNCKRARLTAMRNGDACVGGRGDGRADARHDFKGQPRRRKRRTLIAAPSEDKAVAAFQPHHL